MKRLFDLVGKRHIDIVKEAGLFGRAALGAVKAVAGNPGKAIGAGFLGMDLASGATQAAAKSTNARRAAEIASSAPHVLSQGTI